MNRLIRPVWVDHWYATRPTDTPSAEAATAVVDAVREGLTLPDTVTRAGLTEKQVLATVAMLGTRCTQVGKNGPKVASIVAAEPGAPGEATFSGDSFVVHAADGWLRSRRKGDIRRAYAALLAADEPVLAEARRRVAADTDIDTTMRYGHFADLHAAARGDLPPLHLVVTSPAAAAGYLAAWETIDDAVAAATQAVDELLRKPSPRRTYQLAQKAFWLVPHAGVLGQRAAACAQARSGNERLAAEHALRHQLEAVRQLAVRQPRRLYPTRLEQLNIVQVRALAAQHRLRPEATTVAREDAAREALAAIRDERRGQLLSA